MILRNPRVLLVCVGIAAAVLAAVSLRYFSQYQPLSAFTNGGLLGGTEQIALEADDVQVVGRSAGKVRWRFAAQTVTLSRDRRVVSISGIRRGALYAADSRPSVSLTADRASYTTPFGILGVSGMGALQVSGNVKASVLSPAHPSFRTQQIVWDSASNTLSCPVPVTATLPKLLVTAGSAQYASPPGGPERGVMRLSGGVHARFDSTRGIATLDCPGLTWNAAGQSAQTVGPVTATIPGGLGTAAASDISVNTQTGDLSGHGFRGTLRLSHEVQ
jgi:hypothetical protein